MKTPKIADFREKVVLLKASVTVDDELNRVETVAPVKECWAAVEVKSTSIENTPAGTRPARGWNRRLPPAAAWPPA